MSHKANWRLREDWKAAARCVLWLDYKAWYKHLGTLEKSERPSPYAQGVHPFIKRYTDLATTKGHKMSS